MIIENELQTRPDWEIKVGPDIAGEPNPALPTDYGIDQSFPPIMRLYTAGPARSDGKSADWMAALHGPILPNTGNLTLRFDMMVDNNAGAVQAREFDTRVSIAGDNYNFSTQINEAAGGKLQISDAKGNWQDTGDVIPPFIPGVWNEFEFAYQFNPVFKTYSTADVTVNGTRYMIPPALWAIPVTRPTPLWADSCSIQLQLDLSPKGGKFAQQFNHVQLEWS